MDVNKLLELLFAGGVAVIIREMVAALKTRSDVQRQNKQGDFEVLNKTIQILQREIERRQHEAEVSDDEHAKEVAQLKAQIRQLESEKSFLSELNQQYLMMLRAEGIEI